MLDRLKEWGLPPIPVIEDCYQEIFSGKSLRSSLVKFFSSEFKLSSEKTKNLAEVIEMLHFATLVHDDVCDQSLYRRKKLAKWRKFSQKEAVLGGDFLLVSAYLEVSSYRNFNLMDYSAKVTSGLILGELLQDMAIKEEDFSQNKIEKIHELKTGSLFSWCFVTPYLMSCLEDPVQKRIDQLHELGLLLGGLFQRADDLLDFDIRNDEGKIILGDISSGYLNSFGCTLGLEKAKKFETISELQKELGGKSVFDQKFKEYDELSAKLILNFEDKSKEVCEEFNFSSDFRSRLSSLGKSFYMRSIPEWL